MQESQQDDLKTMTSNECSSSRDHVHGRTVCQNSDEYGSIKVNASLWISSPFLNGFLDLALGTNNDDRNRGMRKAVSADTPHRTLSNVLPSPIK
jgi:hypothetical protein